MLAAALCYAAPPPASIRSEDILNHLEDAIAWYRHLLGIDQASDDLLVRQNVHDASLRALQSAFDFARAGEPLAAPETSANTARPGQNLQQAISRAADRVANVKARIAGVDAAIAKSSGKKRADLQAQRKELAAELDLANTIQNSLQLLATSAGSSIGGGLDAQIDELERTVPEVRRDKPGGPPHGAQVSNANAAPQPLRTDSQGMIGLIGDFFSLRARRRQVDGMSKATDSYLAKIDKLRAPLLNEIRSTARRADEIAAEEDPAADSEARQRELAAMTDRFKQVSKAMVPLVEEARAAGSARGYLQESIGDLDEAWRKSAQYLALRIAAIVGAIFLILLLSEAWRRATFRYVSDLRRRRQFLTLRRIVVVCAVILVVMGGLVTEFGSLATYAGFVTAGVAVALQSPILSIVAYFFLIGRYGLRVGDRVTVSNVTGQVIEIGLVRFYLMELGPDMRSTGRVVVFSNSVIFQPSALYKQMPGVDYVWHRVTLTLASDSDAQLAESKLNAAADSVYQTYRDKVERQHRLMEQTLDVDISAPRPETRMRYTDAGLEFTVRYPAELKQAASTDDQLLRALYDAIENEPKLKFAPAGRPKIQMAA
jgi:small-conductance mechanosensitive channel